MSKRKLRWRVVEVIKDYGKAYSVEVTFDNWFFPLWSHIADRHSLEDAKYLIRCLKEELLAEPNRVVWRE